MALNDTQKKKVISLDRLREFKEKLFKIFFTKEEMDKLITIGGKKPEGGIIHIETK